MKGTDKPFQNLCFLVRDWRHADIEGSSYINEVFEITNSQPEALKEVRRYIRSSYDAISCVLMKNPGDGMAEANYDGCWSV